MTTLHWVRHGPTHAKGMIGWTDRAADLSDTAQIARLSAALPPQALLISSDLSRTIATADALEHPGRTRMAHDPRLRELHFGDWEDRTFDDVSAEDPDAIRAFWERPGPTRAPGGESWDQMARRVSAAADLLSGLGGHVIIVAHFGAILSQIQRARGVSTTEVFAQKIDNLSITRLHWGGTAWREDLTNHCP